MQKRVDLFRNLPCQAIDKHAGAKNQDANAKREYICLQMVDGLIDVSDSLFRKYPVWKPARGTIDEPTDQCGDDEELYHGLCRRASFIKFCAVPFMHIELTFSGRASRHPAGGAKEFLGVFPVHFITSLYTDSGR